jgi:hypothetical protein
MTSNITVRNTVKKSRTTFDAHKNPHTLATSPSDQVKSQEMEMNMETVEERMYEVSKEAEGIDVPLTDRDTVMENLATRFVKHKKEEPEKKLVVVRSHMRGLDSVRSMDGDTFRVVHDAKKKCVNIMFDQETTEPISCEVDKCTSRALKRTGQEPAEEMRMAKLFAPKNVETSTLQPPNTESFKVGAKHIKKAAKKIRQNATRNGAVTAMKDKWQLKCTHTSCTAGVGGAPFRTPALIPKDAIAQGFCPR